jgi:hypothetical protein
MIRRLRQSEDTRGPLGPPPVSILWRVAVALLICLLCIVPILLVMAAASTDSWLHEWSVRSVLFWFPLWGLFAVWVTLDAATLLAFAAPRPDPLGSKALTVSLLGLVNVISICVFVGVAGKR